MPFMHPAIFWSGVGAASVPIIIHLLNRRRFRMREWAAMKFLLDSLRKNRRRLKMEELILLLLRCLVVLMLALALAKFTGCSAMEALPFGRAESETAVFIIDDSYSMGQRAGTEPLFASAAAELAEQLRTLPMSAKVAIFSTSDHRSGEKPAELKTITDIQSVVKHLRDRRLSDNRADFAGALKATKRILAGVTGPKRLYVQSDFRRVDLTPPDRAEELRRLFDDLQSSGVGIVAADYGTEARSNLTIEQMVLAEGDSGYEGLVLARAPFRLRVTVRNNSPAPVSQVEVKLTAMLAADKDPAFRAVAPKEKEIIPSIGPGQSRTCEFTAVCNRAGPAVLKAELPQDELAGDNVAFLALDVREAIAVLVVDDRSESADSEAADSYFLRAALQPGGEDIYGCRVKVVTGSKLAGEALDDYDVVVLVNVARFPVSSGTERGGLIVCKQVKDLEEYVRAGGGLAIFTGDSVDTTFYKNFLYADGAGLCPYEIGQRIGEPRQRGEFFRMKVVDDPVARNVRGGLMRFARLGDMDTTGLMRFYAFTAARVPKSLDPTGGRHAPAAGPVVLARFSDPADSPAIALRTFGKGKALMYYTTANREWTDWPAEGADCFYVTAVNDMVRFLARQQDPALNGLAGEPFDYKVSRRLRGADARLTGLAEHTAEVSQRWERIGERLQYENPLRAQGYVVNFNRAGLDAGVVFFARNPDPAEGELAPGGKAALDAVIRGKYEYTHRQADSKPQALWGRPAREYWTWALVAMLVFLAIETYLAQKFGHYT